MSGARMMRINVEVTEGSRLKQIYEIQVINRGTDEFDITQYQVNFNGNILPDYVRHIRADGALELARRAIEEVLGG